MSEFKYLGVILNKELEFTRQMNENLKRANHKIYLLSKFRSFLDKKMALNLYKTMVLPFIEFANAMLLGSSVKDKKRAQKMQNRGLRLALGRNKYYSTVLLQQEAKMTSWESRAFLSLNRLMFKYKFNEDFIQDNTISTRLYEGTVFKLERPNSSGFRRSISYLGRKSWNELPSYLRSIDVFDCFKVLLRGHYRENFVAS